MVVNPHHYLKKAIAKYFTIGAQHGNGAMSQTTESRIPCSQDTRKLIAAQKRGGETYDTLLQKMAKQYDPEKGSETPEGKD